LLIDCRPEPAAAAERGCRRQTGEHEAAAEGRRPVKKHSEF
jgi:hypothetical protein